MSKIHTTIGIYNNGDIVMNGVIDSNLQAHIDYNLTYRPGRAFFVDGKCLHEGYLSKLRIKAFKAKFKSDKTKYTATEDTTPYR